MKAIPILFLYLFLILQTSEAETDLSDVYDENTEITITGAILDSAVSKRGPVIISLSPGRKVYYIVTAPPWFLLQQDIIFNSGHQIEVKGSKYYSRDGNIFIIARAIKIHQTGRKIILRDMNLRPLWGGRQGMQKRQP